MSKKNSQTTNKANSMEADEELVAKVREVKEKYEMDLLKSPGITAVSIGLMTDDDGKYTADVGICIYYDPAKANSVVGVPPTLDNIRTQLLPGGFERPVEKGPELAEMPANSDNVEQEIETSNPRKRTIEPMIGGIGVGPNFFYLMPRKYTLGLIVRDRLTGELMIMSTSDAITREWAEVGDGVSQPARGRLPRPSAANLVRWHRDNVTFEGRNYYIDAAVALPKAPRSCLYGMIYGIADYISRTGNVRLGGQVTKSGVGGITEGLVVNINYTVITPSGIIHNMFVVQADQQAAFATEHDRGSAILALNRHGVYVVVGLLNGGTATHSLCSMIGPILAQMGCELG